MIVVQNLVKKFADFTAVNDISFHVPKGEIFAFLGPNGAGKTTTVITHVDPLTYGVDGLRTALIGVSHFGAMTDLVALLCVGIVLLFFGAWRFSKIEI